MNIDDVRLIHSRKLRNRSEVDTDKDTKKGLPGNLKDDTENLLSYAAPGQNFAAEVRKDSVLGQIGRYLPDISCRVPKSAICMELVNMSQPVKSTQPLVVEAPHILWGTARDPLFHEVAVDGCPFVDRRNFEFFPDSEIQKVEHSESLMLITSTVWVDYLPQHENMQSLGSVVRNNAAGIMEKANNLLNDHLSLQKIIPLADKTSTNTDVGCADGEQEVHSCSSIILEEEVHSQHLKRNLSSEQLRLPRRSSIEFNFASEIANTGNSILSQCDAVVKYDNNIKQTLLSNGDIAISSAMDNAKISHLHSSLSPSKATISRALKEKHDNSSSTGNEAKQDIFLKRTVSEGHRNSNVSINKPSDQNKLKTNSSSKGQAHDASQLSSLIISLKGSCTVPSDISSKHSLSSHASIMTKSSLECNESIHFKSIASGTFSSNPINIQACQRNKPDTGICIGPIPKSDLLECCASTSDSVAKYSAIEMSEFPSNQAPQSPEIKHQFFKSNAFPSIHAPESPEINTEICKSDIPPIDHASERPEINSLKLDSATPPGIISPETAELNTLMFKNDAPLSVYVPKSPEINNGIRKDNKTPEVQASLLPGINSKNFEYLMRPSLVSKSFIFESDSPPSIHAPESPVFKEGTSTVDRLNVADALGFRKEWSTLKSDNKAAMKPPADNGDHIIYLSCLNQSKATVSSNTPLDDERNICSQRQSQSTRERKNQTHYPVSGPEKSSLSPNIDAPYILVLDEIIYFNVVEFPEGDVIASFPVSVASVLSERTVGDRDRLPGVPSELTLTFCQEPSMEDQVWGVEATVTFRCSIADPPRGRKVHFLNRKRGSKNNQETKTQKPEKKSTIKGQKMDDDHSSLKSESQMEDYMKEVQSDLNDFSSCASASIFWSNNLFYDAQVEPEANVLMRRRGQKSPTSNESSSLYGWDLANGGSFEPEVSQTIFSSLLSHPQSSAMLHDSVRVDQFDVYAAPHLNSNEVEYDKSPNAGTGSIPAQHEEELNFNKGKKTAEKRSSLHLFLQSSKEYVMNNVAKCFSSVGEENDKISLIRKDLIKQGSIMGSVGEESFKAALRANNSDKWSRSSFSGQRTKLNSQESSCQVIPPIKVSQNISEGAPDIHKHGDSNASDGNFAQSEEIARSRWLQLNPLIRTWTWVPTFLKLLFNFYSFSFVGVVFAIFLALTLVNYY